MDWSSSVSGAISGGLGIVGSLVNYGLQKKLAAQQNQYNIDMWKMNNEYNSPSAQMRRYEEAGLNPALMYGQVTPGNSSSGPSQVTPQAPGLSRDFAELGKAFNIEGLKQAIADTRLKQANAKIAQTEAAKAADEYDAMIALGNNYRLDPFTGKFVFDPGDRGEKEIGTATGRYYMLRYLADNFRTNSLLAPRGRLISTQAALNSGRAGLIPSQLLLNNLRGQMFAPQIQMLRYQNKYYPVTFWIGNTKNAVQTAAPFVTPFL